MKLFIEYVPPNWNKYIYAERTNLYVANKIKQQEKQIVQLLARGRKYTGEYPVEVIVRPHFQARREDLDNCRYKGLLDGLVAAGVLKNDNLKHIQKITLEPIFDDKVGIEFEIKEMEK